MPRPDVRGWTYDRLRSAERCLVDRVEMSLRYRSLGGTTSADGVGSVPPMPGWAMPPEDDAPTLS